MSDDKNIKVLGNGPLLVNDVPLYRLKPTYNEADRPVDWERGAEVETGEGYALCRCGASANKPFCDGAHASAGFDGTETADRGPIAARQEKYEGPGIVMNDDSTLCYHAGFCVREHSKAWGLVEQAADRDSRAQLIDMIQKCPSGRLEYYEPPDDRAVEQELDQEIGVIADGPLWVRGGIPVEGADGEAYEVRNRVTLCRCGASKNKPLCDGTHIEIDFKAE